MRRIYVASSWRNPRQPAIVQALRAGGAEVYDFRNPRPENIGFQWSDIDPNWQQWGAEQFRDALHHPVAVNGFGPDFAAMEWANTCVLVLPCGRSAHLEAGYFTGAGKELYILLAPGQEPELMYRMATKLCLDVDELVKTMGTRAGTGVLV